MARSKITSFKDSLQQTLAFNQVSEIDLIYKAKMPPIKLPKVNNPQRVADLVRQQWDPGKINLCEKFKVCLVNGLSGVLGICEVSSGSIKSTLAEPSFIIGLAILSNARGIILIHNHPSGCLIPSDADLKLTSQIKNACKLFNINLLDHLILTDSEYFSFADNGLL